ncbi:MAG: HlyD family efflux transporter periplasmic adaptor subunit [Candidatus Falkowbacteria bacterium]|nr:HlyD family efflux transporter periplasmic adaptor subunit [Candidatus Falkowbacteria bacterium]
MKKKYLISFLVLMVFSLTACGKKEEPAIVPAPEAIKVKAQTIAASLSAQRELQYSGLVVSESEAKIVAKTSGTITNFKLKVGDKVSLGQELAKIDDVNSASYNPANFNSSQIKQAKLGVSQAQSSYQLSRTSYNNLLISSVKDLRQAEIARNQAEKGSENLAITTTESIKSAELAYETSKIATEQARLTLENRKKQSAQSASDIKDNAGIAADSSANLCGTLISSINAITGLDEDNTASISYKINLGALDSTTYGKSKDYYKTAKAAYQAYLKKSFPDTETKVNETIVLVQSTKTMVDAVKLMFEKTVSSSDLPQSSMTGTSLSGLQASVAAYQSQINASLNQVNAAKQGLSNTALNNDSLLETLQKAYELSVQQQASALQALNNLKAGNTSQTDQSEFVLNLAQNQFDNAKVKIESQIAAAKVQMDNAESQYNNALLNLQSLYDIHSIVSPIIGTITQKANDGDSVAAGQVVATISQPEKIKVKIFVEPENLSDLKPGLLAVVSNGNEARNGIISSISPQADSLTRRFPVEIVLENADSLYLGTVVDVKIIVTKSVAGEVGTILLPLSSLEVGQNGNSVMMIENNKAKKIPVVVVGVLGDLAKVKITDYPSQTLLIVEGNKLVKEGDLVSYDLTGTSTPSIINQSAVTNSLPQK